MPLLEGQPVQSAGHLQSVVGWCELRERYDVDGFTVRVDDLDEAERLVAENPHLSFADAPEPDTDEEPARATATTDGVEFDGESDAEESAAELADVHWNTAVSAIESGDADAFLDELESVDDRKSVQDAIAERRAG